MIASRPRAAAALRVIIVRDAGAGAGDLDRARLAIRLDPTTQAARGNNSPEPRRDAGVGEFGRTRLSIDARVGGPAPVPLRLFRSV